MDRLEISILGLLLKNDDYVTYDFISNKLSVSTRTVMRSIKEVEVYLKPFNIELEAKKRNGFKLTGSLSDFEKLKASLQKQSPTSLSKSERDIIILYELFCSEDSVKIYYLSYLLNVSIGTINRDLENIGVWLEKNKLKLEVLRGNGIRIAGNRHHVRQAIMNLLIQNINFKTIPLTDNENFSIDLFNDSLSVSVRKSLLDLFDFESFQETMKFVNEFDYTLASNFVYEDYLKHIMYINILLHKSYINEKYEECLINLDLKEHDQYLRMKELAKKIKKSKQIVITESDICNLTAVYLSMRPIEASNAVYNYDEDIYEASLWILDEVEKDLNLKLNRDEQLIELMVTHLKLMVKRIQMGIVINNNYLDTVKKEYPKVFDSVKKHIEEFSINRDIIVSEDEIAYIAVYILANIIRQENENQRIKAVLLCMNGFGTSKMLEQSIKNKLPMIEVAAVISTQGVNEAELVAGGVDLIISTIKINTVIIPNILVNPFVSEDDFLALNKKCGEIISKNKLTKSKEYVQIEPSLSNKENQGISYSLQKIKTMYDILKHFHCGVVAAENMNQLLQAVSQEAFLDKGLRDSFIKELKYRESLGSTVIDEEGIVLFHCKLENEIRLHFYSLVNPVNFLINNKLTKICHVVLMVVPNEPEDLLLREFSYISEALVQDKELMRLINDGSEERVFRYLANSLFNSTLL